MTSFLDNIPTIVRAVVDTKPKRILDIGAGFGKFGLLIREALLSKQAEAGDMNPVADFKIDACESADYFLGQRAFDRIYDTIISDDIRLQDAHFFEQYDLILLIDVIEHWPKEDYLAFMEKIPATTKTLISTPKEVVFYEQPYYGIDKHQTQFTIFDFEGQDLSTKDSLIYLI
jgi:2-polyprenyl-3-methyl-5-hydroxy-6-metoxy-1,4-benzoquinol methylase